MISLCRLYYYPKWNFLVFRVLTTTLDSSTNDEWSAYLNFPQAKRHVHFYWFLGLTIWKEQSIAETYFLESYLGRWSMFLGFPHKSLSSLPDDQIWCCGDWIDYGINSCFRPYLICWNWYKSSPIVRNSYNNYTSPGAGSSVPHRQFYQIIRGSTYSTRTFPLPSRCLAGWENFEWQSSYWWSHLIL